MIFALYDVGSLFWALAIYALGRVDAMYTDSYELAGMHRHGPQ